MQAQPTHQIDHSLLYQLALSIGQSMSVEENCKTFVETLIAGTDLCHGSVWLRENVHDPNGDLPLFQQYASVGCTTVVDRLPHDHYILSQLREKRFFRIASGEENFCKVVLEEGVEEGSYFIYQLGVVGFVKFYIKNNNKATDSLAKLVAVAAKPFGLLLNGLLAYDNLCEEKESKRQIEDAFNNSEEKYRCIFESMSEGIIITDKEGRVTYLNDQVTQLTGYSKEQIEGHILFELLLSPENQKVLRSKLKDRLHDISDTYTIECIRENGTTWIAKVKASPYKNTAGEIIGTVGAIFDVTDQVMNEQKIIDSEEKLRKIITNSIDGVVIFNSAGIVQEWSNQAEDIFCYTAEETLGQKIEHFIPTFSRSKNFPVSIFGNENYLGKIIETNSSNAYNKVFPIEVSMNVVELRGEKLYSCFIRDISKRKQVQEDLIKAKRMAEQACLAEQQFLANMSHEIRTPMNAVIGMTHLLSKTALDDTQTDYLSALNFSAKSLMGIINNILDISKIEAGEIEFEKRPFSLKPLLTSIYHSFQFSLKGKELSINLDFDPNIKNQIIGDPTRLGQILNNVVGNACKFTESGKINISAKLLASVRNDYIIQFEIKDTGIGIPKEKINDIFENFKQAGTDITRKYGGTGLGLPIVKQLVAIQGGSIVVDSEPNNGTTFQITLPFENSGMIATEISLEKNSNLVKDQCIQNAHFLFVEDNLMNQKLITAILDNWNCSYDMANHGQEAVDMCLNKKYDLIFMDVHMPVMDGLQATVKIRRHKEGLNNQTPIIALTAAALLEEKKRAIQVGMNDFLTKPLAPERLRDTMVKYLLRRKEQPTGKKELYNLDSLKKLSIKNPDFFSEMISIYLNDVPLAIREMEQCYKREEWEQIGLIAHKVKSNFMIVNAEEAVELALQIEKGTHRQHGKVNQLEIQEQIMALKKEADASCLELEGELV